MNEFVKNFQNSQIYSSNCCPAPLKNQRNWIIETYKTGIPYNTTMQRGKWRFREGWMDGYNGMNMAESECLSVCLCVCLNVSLLVYDFHQLYFTCTFKTKMEKDECSKNI